MSVEAPENKCLSGLAARQSQCRAARGAEHHVSAESSLRVLLTQMKMVVTTHA